MDSYSKTNIFIYTFKNNTDILKFVMGMFVVQDWHEQQQSVAKQNGEKTLYLALFFCIAFEALQN